MTAREWSYAKTAGSMRLNSVVHWLAKWQIVLICGVLTIAFTLFLSATDRAAPAGTPGIIQLELAFSEDRFSDIVEQWSQASTLQIQQRNLWIDLLFPFAYVLLLSGLVAWLTRSSHEKPSAGLIALLSLPFIAGLLDWIENVFLLFRLRDVSSFAEPLVFLASAVSLAKWILILVTVLAIIYCILRRVLDWSGRSCHLPVG